MLLQVNPVTGKMERVDPASAAGTFSITFFSLSKSNEPVTLARSTPDGKHTDGSLRLDNRYVNAAKDLGLGGDAGGLVFSLHYGIVHEDASELLLGQACIHT